MRAVSTPAVSTFQTTSILLRGRLKTHTDGEGHTTSYEYGQDGLPTQHTNALGHTFGYHYDKARRLVGLTNENGARYRFAYDVLDRLIAESGFNHKLTGYRYNASNELVEQRELGDDASLTAKLMAQLRNFAVRDQEVLIKGAILAEAILFCILRRCLP